MVKLMALTGTIAMAMIKAIAKSIDIRLIDVFFIAKNLFSLIFMI